MSYDAFRRWRDRADPSPTLSVVVPAYNEAERILPTLGAFGVVISSLVDSWELIVSDDGSQDGTADLVAGLGWANLTVLRHANTGKGGAVRRGVERASGKAILFADADNSTPIEELPRLLAKLDEGFDVVVGSRAAPGAREENKSPLRHLASTALRSVAALLSGVQVKDTQCGFKLFTGAAARELFGRQRLDGFSFDLELLFVAAKLELRVAELPVHWYDAPGSKVNTVRDSFGFLRDIVKLRRLERRGAYQEA